MAANGYLVVAAVLLITALMIEPALSQDTVPPQIFNCLMDDLGGMTVSITSQTATATWTAPAAVNFQPGGTPTNPDSQSNVYSQFSGVTPFNYGFTTVRYLFIDNPPGSAQQNSAICSFFVRIGLVTDVVSPTVSNCPSDTTQFISSGQTSASVTWIEPTASDNNGVVRRSWRSHAPGFQFPPGSTEVFYQWIDPTNPNTPVECRFNVILSTLGTDATVPSLTCPNDVVANPTTGVATWIVPIPFDSSGISTTTPSHNPGDVFSEGFTDVTYSTVDNFNNRASCSFTVRRSPSTEQYVPVITSCPENIQQVLPAGSTSGSVTWPAVTAYDDSGHLRLLMQTYSSGASFPLGTTPVEYRYQDAAGKIARCVFTVGLTVQAGDTTPPIITCPSNIVRTATNNVVTWSPATATDSGQPGVTVTQSGGPASGTTFAAGTTTQIQYTATDAAGNTATCTFNVVIQQETTPPTINCVALGEIAVTAADASGSTVTWPTPTAFDASGIASVLPFPETQSSSGSFFPFGPYAITYRALDNAGNAATCDVTFSVVDRVPPVFNCPSTLMREIPVGSNQVVINFPAPTATDNSGAVPSVRLQDGSQGPGQSYGPGTITVTYVATDGNGNSAICTFNVVISAAVDTVPPVLTSCPTTMLRAVELGTGDTVQVNWSAPTATDNSNLDVNVQLIRGQTPNSVFSAGVYDIAYRLSDTSGNFVDCEFCIVVTTADSLSPTITCPADIVRTVELGTATGDIVSWSPVVATDSSGGPVEVVLQTDRPSGSFFPVGQPNSVSYQAIDLSGNSVSCSFTVTVNLEDTTPPVFTFCPGNILYSTLTIPAGGIQVTWAQPQFYDASGSARITSQVPAPGTAFTQPFTQVTYTVEDNGGRSAVCTFQVTLLVQNPCTVSPCQNGGNCVPTGQGTNEYNCVCPPCFSGPTCALSVNACQNNMCASGSQCVPVMGSCVEYTCQCNSCSYGRFCDQQVDGCANHKCENGGLCNTFGNSCLQFSCACSGCFQGPTCNELFNPCNPSPCQNNGVCSAIQNSCTAYTCRCTGCFTGYNCQIAIPDPCLQNPCQNNGICRRRENTCFDYVCECSAGFAGLRCDQIVVRNNPCNSFPCLNGADCVNMDGGLAYTCKCQSGYTGTNCGIQTTDAGAIDSCASNPCQSGSTCRNSYHSTSPLIYTGQYVCNCNTFLTGVNCNTAVATAPTMNVCGTLFRPCANGGTCMNIYNSYLQSVDYCCACQSGFFGQHCEIQFSNPCVPNPCLNGGGCVASGQRFSCACPPNFSGNICDIEAPDTTPPTVINCPTSFSFDAGSQATINVPWSEPQAVDGTVFYRSHMPNSEFTAGTSTRIIYVFADAAGNLATCAFNILVTRALVVDSIMPTITCPSPPTAILRGDASTVRVTWSPPVAADNQGQPLVTSNRQSGSLFTEGVTPVTYTATDFSNNRATCTFDVTVTRQGGFSIQCPATVNLPVSAGLDCYTYVLPNPTYSNTVGAVTLGYRLIGGGATSREFYTTLPFSGSFQYRAVDSAGNLAECTFTLTITPGVVVDPCSSNPCLNGGTCSASGNTFTCTCPSGFTGVTCNVPITGPCSSNPCVNGGTCSASGNTFTCTCPSGFTGVTCNVPSTGLSCPPVAVSGTPGTTITVNIPEPTVPGNTGNVNFFYFVGGLQISNPRSYPVTVPASGQSTVTVSIFAFDGSTTLQCNSDIVVTAGGTSPCGSNPCVNGGTCNVIGQGYTCTCPQGFSGINCQLGSNLCSPNPCQNGGACSLVGSTFSCACTSGFTGLTCTTPIVLFTITCQNLITASGTAGTTVLVNIPQPTISGTPSGSVQVVYLDAANNQITNSTAYPVTVPASGTSIVSVSVQVTDGAGRLQTCTIPIQVAATTVNPCNPNPCQNGGTCAISGSGFLCSCPIVWVGATCASFNPCNSNPCPAGMECYFRPDSFVCGPPSSGRRRRDVPLDGDYSLCDEYPCYNNATCISGVDEEHGEYMRCDCAPGWTGPSCERANGEMIPSDADHPPSWMDDPPAWIDHSLARLGKENLGMHWTMVAVIAVLALVVMTMACGFMQLVPRKRGRIDDVKLIH